MGGAMEMEWDALKVNPERLDEELRALGIGAYAGLSTGGGKVRVHLVGEWTEADQATIRAAVERHDPAEKSRRQQAVEARQAALAALRKPWQAWTGDDKDAFLRLAAAEWGLIPEE